MAHPDPDLVYHGTSRAQFERLRLGGYEARNLYVGEDVDNVAWPYAEKQSRRDGADPVILTLRRSLLPAVEDDLHRRFDGSATRQAGQWFVNGPVRQAVVSAVAETDGGTVDLPLDEPGEAPAP
jgi:hypothetical protein